MFGRVCQQDLFKRTKLNSELELEIIHRAPGRHYTKLINLSLVIIS